MYHTRYGSPCMKLKEVSGGLVCGCGDQPPALMGLSTLKPHQRKGMWWENEASLATVLLVMRQLCSGSRFCCSHGCQAHREGGGSRMALSLCCESSSCTDPPPLQVNRPFLHKSPRSPKETWFLPFKVSRLSPKENITFSSESSYLDWGGGLV